MKKILILIPVFNDWESLYKLINEINEIIKNFNDISINCLVVNDASTIEQPKIKKPDNFKSFKVLNMIKNKGHARCNAFGIKYVCKNEKFDYLILMDGDGEDRPVEIKDLINSISNNPDNSIVAKRIKRSEGLFFQFLYFMHKLITFIFTGEKINFGNYSCLTKEDAVVLSSKPSLWSSYSGTVKKNIKNLNEIDSIRGTRYFGPTKMSLFKLLIHSFSIIAVFKYKVFVRSLAILLILGFLNFYIGSISILLQIVLISFCVIIFFVSLRENRDELDKSQENLKNIKEITH
tara:strand:- start:97 stop:969 length:873 start_codon:yes stop_codon:yes gene_type:complete